MADPGSYLCDFRVERALSSYAHFVMREVSLRPAVGRLYRAPLARASAAYLRRWRARVNALAHAGAAPVVGPGSAGPGRWCSRKWRMLNCPPPFALYTPRARPCGVPNVCPSCWARDAAGTWRRLDRRLFGEPPRPPTPRPARPPRLAGVTLLGRRVVAELPERFRPGAYLDRRLAASARRRRADLPRRAVEVDRFRDLGAVAGLDATRFGWDEGRWTVSFRQLLLLPTAGADAFLAHPYVASAGVIGEPRQSHYVAPRVDLMRIDDPDRRAVARLAAHALRYSPFLLGCPAGVVWEYLLARRGHRLVAAFGHPGRLADRVVP